MGIMGFLGNGIALTNYFTLYSLLFSLFPFSLPRRVLAAKRTIDNRSARRRGFSRGEKSGRVHLY